MCQWYIFYVCGKRVSLSLRSIFLHWFWSINFVGVRQWTHIVSDSQRDCPCHVYGKVSVYVNGMNLFIIDWHEFIYHFNVWNECDTSFKMLCEHVWMCCVCVCVCVYVHVSVRACVCVVLMWLVHSVVVSNSKPAIMLNLVLRLHTKSIS